MKTKLELIKNYPIESLKNWGDYFGYPESICEKMTDMVDSTDWQNAKIGVLDDFGFQMIRYLINVKKVPLQNIYFLVSEEDETKVELMKKWYSNFIENEIFSIYNINMSFDLIIANPPYGLSNSIAKKIIPVLLEKAKDVVVLVPKNTYKSKALWEKVAKINVIKENVFEDASVQNLTIAKLSKGNSNELDFEELILTEKQKVLRKAIKAYNTVHPTKLIRKVPFGNKIDPKTYKIGEVTLEDAIKQGRIFANTVWTPLDGVHTNQAHDWVCNLQNKWPKEYFDKMPVNLTLFPNKQERDNFSKWWYSCLEKEQGKKLRRGLTNACLDLIRDCRSANGEGYLELFPQVDWSKSWTDAEILKEIGLQEDFLEERG